MGATPWIMVILCTIFLVIWMALTFTNKFCDGMVGFGLCYKVDCPVCPTVPAPAPATTTTTSSYMRQPYSM